MAKTTEERFNIFAPIWELAQYLRQVRAKIQKNEEEGKIKDPAKAQAYIDLIGEVLALPYFRLNGYVRYLIECVKEDYALHKERVARTRKKIDEVKKTSRHCEEQMSMDDYLIPDEDLDRWASLESAQFEARMSIAELEMELRQEERAATLQRQLLGMAARPKGFFDGLL